MGTEGRKEGKGREGKGRGRMLGYERGMRQEEEERKKCKGRK